MKLFSFLLVLSPVALVGVLIVGCVWRHKYLARQER